ncbi:Uncharacterized protein APZ42_017511 [Daphnia magna]|uniref:Uncharacterized protein n=1 Tax=Daphnia magna TaxID=35525 RepID=A0A162CKD6_9CRUS|nr:Uncharacterized protein APZ42_017511 [Daphnia magna]
MRAPLLFLVHQSDLKISRQRHLYSLDDKRQNLRRFKCDVSIVVRNADQCVTVVAFFDDWEHEGRVKNRGIDHPTPCLLLAAKWGVQSETIDGATRRKKALTFGFALRHNGRLRTRRSHAPTPHSRILKRNRSETE